MKSVSAWILEDSGLWLARLQAKLALAIPAVSVRSFCSRLVIEEAWEEAKRTRTLPDAVITDLFVPDRRWQRWLIDFGDRHPRLTDRLVGVLPSVITRRLRFLGVDGQMSSWWGGVEFLNRLLSGGGSSKIRVFVYTLCANPCFTDDYPGWRHIADVAFSQAKQIALALDAGIYAKGRFWRGGVVDEEDELPKLLADLRQSL